MSIVLPQYIAHRGLSSQAPENTMAAFRLAEAKGYSMFECDVQVRKDNVPVIVHDDIARFNSKEIAQFPTLQEVLEWMCLNRINMNLELKGVQPNLSQRVAEVLKPFLPQLQDRILISSFEFLQLIAFKALCPNIPRALLIDKKAFKTLGFEGIKQQFHELQAVSLNLDVKLVNSKTIVQFKDISPILASYTVEPGKAQALFALGVAAVFTNG